MLLAKELILKTFPDVHFNFHAFAKAFSKDDQRYGKNIRFLDFLRSQGFEVVEKIVKKLDNIIDIKGTRTVYEYEECDMDGEIIHAIHTLGSKYQRLIILSGDDDMLNALKYVQEHYGTEIIVIAHKENMSNNLKQFRSIALHELFNPNIKHIEKEIT